MFVKTPSYPCFCHSVVVVGLSVFVHLQRWFVGSSPPPPLRQQDSGVADYMGMFAVACMGCDKLAKEFEDLNDDYSKIMVQVRKLPA